jgi:alkylation response protein AidB-like acyl-CoA dehydrogenase
MPGAKTGPAFQGPLYRFPMLGACVAATLPPIALALGREAIDEACNIVTKKTALGSMKALRERGVTHAKVARAEAMLSSARAYLYDTLSEVWKMTVDGGRASLEQKATLMLAGAHAAQTAAQVCDAMFGLAGTSAIFSGTRMERLFRDSQVIRQHGFVGEARMENYGQIRLGLESEFAFVAF